MLQIFCGELYEQRIALKDLYSQHTLDQADTIPLYMELLLAQNLRIVRPDAHSPPPKSEELAAQRRTKTRLYLRAWQRLDQKLKPGYDLKDPKNRAHYEEFAEQAQLHNLEAPFKRNCETFLTGSYSQPPFAPEELKQNLATAGVDKITSARILQAVEQNTALYARAETIRQEAAKAAIASGLDPHADPFYLRRDPRLKVTLTLEGQHLHFQDVLPRLREAAALPLLLDPSLELHNPDFGTLGMRNAPAWSVMDLLSRDQMEEGKWEKSGNGYRLVGKSHVYQPPPVPAPAPPPAPSRSYWVIACYATIFILVVALVIYFLFRRRLSPRPSQGGSP